VRFVTFVVKKIPGLRQDRLRGYDSFFRNNIVFMLTSKEFEQITEIEHILTAPRGRPPLIRLAQESVLLFLSEPVVYPFDPGPEGASPKRFGYHGEFLLANAGGTELRLDGCRTALGTMQVEAANLPMHLAPHSSPRRFRFTLAGDEAVRISMIPLTFMAEHKSQAQCFVRLATLPAPRDDGRTPRYDIPFGDALPHEDGELEIFPAQLDFGRTSFWGNVNWQVAAPNAKNVEIVGPNFPDGKVSFTAAADKIEWTGSAALQDGEHPCYLQINVCRTVDPQAAQKLQIGPEGIFSLKTVRHNTRIVRLRNLSAETARVQFFSSADWIEIEPAEIKIPPHADAEAAVTLRKENMPLGDFAGAVEVAVAGRMMTIPVIGALMVERKTASIYGNFQGGVLKAGKCFAGKPLEIPLRFRTLGNPVIRLTAFDDLSDLMQRVEIAVADPSRLQEVDGVLRIPTEHLLPQQKTFRLHIESNCYLDNIASQTFEVECEAVHLTPSPKIIKFAFAIREARHVNFLEARRTDGGAVALQWQVSDEIKNVLKITRERSNRLRLDATGTSLPPGGELQGEIHLEDQNSGAREIVLCYLQALGVRKTVPVEALEPKIVPISETEKLQKQFDARPVETSQPKIVETAETDKLRKQMEERSPAAVQLIPTPEVLEVTLLNWEMASRDFIDVRRSDGGETELEWRVGDTIKNAVKVTRERSNRLRVETDAMALPPIGALYGEIHFKDLNSGAGGMIRCYLQFLDLTKDRVKAPKASA